MSQRRLVPYAGSQSIDRPAALPQGRPLKTDSAMRALLVKYMRHVGDHEGTCYTTNLATSSVKFTRPEIEELLRCEADSDALDLTR